jgi:hypothetical protein
VRAAAAQTEVSDDAEPRFDRDGAQRFAGALDREALSALLKLLGTAPTHKAGVRLNGLPGLAQPLAADGAVGVIAAGVLGAAVKPVRAVLFDKTPQTNWALAWHQDRTIVVEHRLDVDGFGPWSRKAGLQHVAPPFSILETMVTVRVHLDNVGAENAPLLVALGSHRPGRLAVTEIEAAVAARPIHACLAEAGDIWLYSTPILHASEAAASPSHRRVLQVDYAARDLPGGLQWLGV